MANSTSPVPQVVEGTGAVPKINEIFDAGSNALTGGRNAATSGLLVWGYLGGRVESIDVANGTLTLAASTTSYIVMKKSDGVVSFSTGTTNWNNSTDYWRLYVVVTGPTTVTSYTDERLSSSGLFGGGGGSGAAWGSISGTLSSQTDLQTALNAKADSSSLGTVSALSYPGGTSTYLRADGTFAAPPGGGMTNPMSAVGDIIIGGTAGAPTALPAGTNGYVLTLVSGAPAWVASGGGSFTGGALSSALDEAKGTDIARAGTTNIAAATGNFVHLTGTTTITALGTAQAGTRRIVRFAGAGTLTHNATSLILPGGANITTAANDCATFVSEGSGNWRCTAYSKASGQAVVVPASTITGFTPSLNTASPNNTVNAARLLANTASTNGALVIQPKGTGALQSSLADATSTGGDARGDYAVDLQLLRNASTDVASGVYSAVLGGYGNMASNNGGVVAGGYFNQNSGYRSGILCGDTIAVSGNWSGVVGGANHSVAGNYAGVTNGQGNVANSDYCRVGGRGATARGILAADVFAHHNGTAGAYQDGRYRFRMATANATPAVATADGSATVSGSTTLGVPNGAAYTFRGKVTAKRAGSSDSKHWLFEGAIVCSAAGTVSLVAAVTPTVLAAAAGASGWSISVTANTGTQALQVTVTGQSGADINWNVVIETCEVEFA